MFEKDITGAKLDKKVKYKNQFNKVAIEKTSKLDKIFVASLSKTYRWNEKVGQNFIRRLNLLPLIIYQLKAKLLRLIGKGPWWCVRQ